MSDNRKSTRLSQSIVDGLIALTRAGLPRATAARTLGFRPGTVGGWCARGRKSKSGLHASLVTGMAKAEAEVIADRISTVVSAAEVKKRVTTKTTHHKDGSVTTAVTECVGGDWRAAAWLLERLEPERFGSHRHELRELRKQFADLKRLFQQVLGPAAARSHLEPPRQKRGCSGRIVTG